MGEGRRGEEKEYETEYGVGRVERDEYQRYHYQDKEEYEEFRGGCRGAIAGANADGGGNASGRERYCFGLMIHGERLDGTRHHRC